MYVCFAAIQCPELPPLVGLHLVPDLRDAGVVVTAICLPGHQFHDSSTIRSLSCSDDGVWSNEIGSCTGKYTPQYMWVSNLNVY